MKIFFDMDGVLADFNRGVIELCHMQPQDQENEDEEYTNSLWSAVRDVDHFYDRLEMMPGAKKLFDNAMKISNGNCEILTGIPKPKRGIITAGEDKIKWVRRLLSPDIKVNIVYKEEKKNFCTGRDCILIDDLAANISAWNTAGGTGILYSNAEQVMKELSEIETAL